MDLKTEISAIKAEIRRLQKICRELESSLQDDEVGEEEDRNG